jgi:hypothetical protein
MSRKKTDDVILKSSPVTTRDTGDVCASITSLIRLIVSPVRVSSDGIPSRAPKYQYPYFIIRVMFQNIRSC